MEPLFTENTAVDGTSPNGGGHIGPISGTGGIARIIKVLLFPSSMRSTYIAGQE